MATTLNPTKTLQNIRKALLIDSVAFARRAKDPQLPANWPPMPDPRGIDQAGIERLIQSIRATDPTHPENWHRDALQRAIQQPRMKHMYFAIRSSLWNWPEFLPLNPKTRLILEIVIELAREEAFPWYLTVQARHVMRLARTNHATLAYSLRTLQHLSIIRPARRIALLDHKTDSVFNRALQSPRWPCPGNAWCVDASQPIEDIPQWVVRYRHGSPRNANRAAWWINYDLLCQTQRVLPCFEVHPDTMPQHYFERNKHVGTRPTHQTEAGFRAFERQFALNGPMPPSGLRVALWEGCAADDI